MDHIERIQASRYKCFKDKKKSARLHTKKNRPQWKWTQGTPVIELQEITPFEQEH